MIAVSVAAVVAAVLLVGRVIYLIRVEAREAEHVSEEWHHDRGRNRRGDDAA